MGQRGPLRALELLDQQLVDRRADELDDLVARGHVHRLGADERLGRLGAPPVELGAALAPVAALPLAQRRRDVAVVVGVRARGGAAPASTRSASSRAAARRPRARRCAARTRRRRRTPGRLRKMQASSTSRVTVGRLPSSSARRVAGSRLGSALAWNCICSRLEPHERRCTTSARRRRRRSGRRSCSSPARARRPARRGRPCSPSP